MRMSHAHEPRAAATEPSRIVDARPSLARRPRDRSIGSVQIAHDVEHNTRAPTTSDASRNHTRTARHAPPMDSDRTQHGGGAARSGRPDWPVGGEVGVPCQPPPAPLNATTSPRWQPPGRCHAARRSPSRGRRRRDNDRPAPPGPACKEEAL